MSANLDDFTVTLLEEHEDYSFKIFRVVRAELQYTRFDGKLSEAVTRINFDRGESAAMLLYDPKKDDVVLVRQFRYPVYAALSANDKSESPGKAWLLEIIAGVKETHLEVDQVANKELLEEAGYEVRGRLRKIATFYPSPGGTSERITVFLGLADSRTRAATGGGVAAEGEDTQVVVLSFKDALAMIDRGEIQDGKTIVALQHLALLKARGADLNFK